MKKLISSFLLLIMLFSLAACGKEMSQHKKSSKSTTQNTSATTGDETSRSDNSAKNTEESTSAQNTDDGSAYYGTWKAVSYEKDGITATIEALKDQGNYFLSHIGLILRSDGKYYFYTPTNDEIAEWKVTANGINADGDDIKFESNKLILYLGDNETIYFEKASEDTTFSQDRTIGKNYFYGTWSIIMCYDTSSKSIYTLAQIKSLNEADWEWKLIFSEDRRLCIKYGNETTIGYEWAYADGAIRVDNLEIPLKDDLLYLNDNSSRIWIFEKVSDEQTIPEIPSESGLRSEFKAAMDAYEEFYDEYLDILKKYKENPTDISLLNKYMKLIGKLSDMDAKFEAWKSEELNAEEMKYYLEVSNRIAQKLLEAAK